MMRWIAGVATAVLTLLVLARAASAQDYAPPQAPYAPAYGSSPAPAPGCCQAYSTPAGPPRAYVPAYGAGQVQPSPGLPAPCCAAAPPAYGGAYSQGGGQGRPRIYVEDMYGQWHEATGEEYARVYAYAQQQSPQPGAPYQYVSVPGPCCVQQPPVYTPPSPPPYQPPHTPPPPSCGGCCAPSYPPPGYPPAPPSCPPSHPPGYGEVHLGDSFFYGTGGVGPDVYAGGGGGGGGYAYAGASSYSYASASASARVSIGGGGYRPPPHRPPPPRGGGGKGCGCH